MGPKLLIEQKFHDSRSADWSIRKSSPTIEVSYPAHIFFCDLVLFSFLLKFEWIRYTWRQRCFTTFVDWGLLFKKRICSSGSKFFSFRIELFQFERVYNEKWLRSHKNCIFWKKKCRKIYQVCWCLLRHRLAFTNFEFWIIGYYLNSAGPSYQDNRE